MTVFQGNINDLMILLIDNSKYQKSSRQISWQLKCTFFCLFSWSILIPKFEIQDAARETVLRIEGPLCQCNMCGDVEFDVLSADGQNKVGKISKQWTGLVKEAFTDADNFGISFPMDLDAKIKGVILGSCFLIDFMFFEESNNHNNNSY